MAPDDRTWNGQERRTNLRLRALIDEIQAGIREHQGALASLDIRMTELTAEVQAIKALVKRPA
jgi:hypothetical protein